MTKNEDEKERDIRNKTILLWFCGEKSIERKGAESGPFKDKWSEKNKINKDSWEHFTPAI